LIDVRQLRYFLAVAEEKHFGKAAARLHIAQPPLSQQIRALEAEIGAALFIRTTRKVELTPAGAVVYERGGRILDDLGALKADVRRVSEGAQGVVRAGFTGTATYGLMPTMVREASERYPSVTLNIRGEMLTPELVGELLEHRLDVAILRPPVNTAQVDLTIVGNDRVVIALPADSPLVAHEALELRMLAGETFVGYPSDSTVAQLVLGACRQAGFVPQIVQEARETSTLLSLVAAGAGVAFVPETAGTLAISGAIFRDVIDAPTIDVAVAWRTDEVSPLVANFVALFRAVAESHNSRGNDDSSTHLDEVI
jgi:DNA-binding transcriptional LysR family regulator